MAAASLLCGGIALTPNTFADSAAQGLAFSNGPSSSSFTLDSRAQTESKVSALTTVQRRPVALDFIPAAERASRSRRGYPPVTVPAGTYGVEGHGLPRSLFFGNGQPMTAGELATRITSDSRYQPGMTVYLMCCETGKGRRSVAQQLANVLGTEVVAPTEKLWPQQNGLFVVAPERKYDVSGAAPSADTDRLGTMKTFKPGRGPVLAAKSSRDDTPSVPPSSSTMASAYSTQPKSSQPSSGSIAKTAALLAELNAQRGSVRYLNSKTR